PVAPPEGVGVQRKRRGALAQRLLLVAEDRRREEIEEPVLAPGGRVRVVQPCRRLEDDAAVAAAADELGELLDRRDARPAAANLGPRAERGHLVGRAALDVDRLALRFLPALLAHERERAPLVLRDLLEPPRRPDQPSQHP